MILLQDIIIRFLAKFARAFISPRASSHAWYMTHLISPDRLMGQAYTTFQYHNARTYAAFTYYQAEPISADACILLLFILAGFLIIITWQYNADCHIARHAYHASTWAFLRLAKLFQHCISIPTMATYPALIQIAFDLADAFSCSR